MIIGGSVDVVKKLIQKENCIDTCINVLRRMKGITLVEQVVLALTRCIEVDSGLKEVYVDKKLEEIIENNHYVDKGSEMVLRLLYKFVDELNEEEEENEFIEKRRRVEEDDECFEEDYDEQDTEYSDDDDDGSMEEDDY